jgi:hypothetical protein
MLVADQVFRPHTGGHGVRDGALCVHDPLNGERFGTPASGVAAMTRSTAEQPVDKV